MHFYSRVWSAVTERDYTRLKEVLEKAEAAHRLNEIDHKNSDDWTPLYYAAINGLDIISSILVEYGAEVDSRNGENDDTPLMAACRNGHMETAVLLRFAGADMSLQNKQNYTVLMICAYNNREELIRRLVRGDGADSDSTESELDELNEKEEIENRRLYRAMSRNIRSNVMLNKKRGERKKGLGDGNEKELKSIPAVDRNKKLLEAAERGHSKEVEKLLKLKDSNVDYKDPKTGNTALFIACSNDFLPTVSVLLLFGADITLLNGQRQSAFDVATDDGRRLMMPLVERPVPIAADLLKAAWLGSKKQLDAILLETDGDLDVNCKNNDGLSPLLLLSRDIDTMKTFRYLDTNKEFFQYKDCSTFLIEQHANVNCSDREGSTPLHFACANNDSELVSQILGSCAYVDSKNKYYNAPIHYACLKGNCDTLMKLIKSGSDVNCQGYAGDTPLHIACYSDHKQAASLLIENGASGSNMDNNGQTPLDVAKSEGLKRLMKTWLLKQKRMFKRSKPVVRQNSGIVPDRPSLTPASKQGVQVLEENNSEARVGEPRGRVLRRNSSGSWSKPKKSGIAVFQPPLGTAETVRDNVGRASGRKPIANIPGFKGLPKLVKKLQPSKKTNPKKIATKIELDNVSKKESEIVGKGAPLEPLKGVGNRTQIVPAESQPSRDIDRQHSLGHDEFSYAPSRETIDFMDFVEERLARSFSKDLGGDVYVGRSNRHRNSAEPHKGDDDDDIISRFTRTITPVLASSSTEYTDNSPQRRSLGNSSTAKEILEIQENLASPGPGHSPSLGPLRSPRVRNSMPSPLSPRLVESPSLNGNRRNTNPPASGRVIEFETIDDLIDIWKKERGSRYRPRNPMEPIRWQKGNVLGQGAFGKVYMGLNEDTGEMIAIKQIPIGNDEALESLTQEIELLKSLNHPHIVRYLGVHKSESENVMNILMEYIPGGSLSNLCERFGRISENVTRIFMHQILQAVQYLHQNGVIHRDIKGANVLVDSDGSIRLADFGASKLLDVVYESPSKSMIGTPYYLAPEVITENRTGFESDIYSAGCTMYEMLTGKPPFADYEPMAAIFRVGNGSIPEIPPSVARDTAAFLSQMLKHRPEDRPSVDELLNSIYMNKTQSIQ